MSKPMTEERLKEIEKHYIWCEERTYIPCEAVKDVKVFIAEIRKLKKAAAG